MSTEFILSIGSNVAERESKISDAVEAICSLAENCKKSDICESPDFNGIGKPYLNILIKGKTDLNLSEFQSKIKDIEKNLGRKPSSKSSGIMPVDIDIVIWNGNIIDPEEYRRPHFKSLFTFT